MDRDRGSEWRKWDLHFHVYGTHLNNQFTKTMSEEGYLDLLHDSEIAVYGITDYFTANRQFEIIDKFYQQYPDSKKAFFINIEYRLDQNVSRKPSGQVNMHLIFDYCRPDSKARQNILKFSNSLVTNKTDEHGVKCAVGELIPQDFDSVCVHLPDVEENLRKTFGDAHPFLKVFAGSGYGGISPAIDPDLPGGRRNRTIAIEFEKQADFLFAPRSSRNFYLNIGDKGKESLRYEGSIAKASIVGSDYHGENSNGQLDKYTWIKADPTFKGLEQILYEPKDRVSVDSVKPDSKVPYQVIDHVSFNQRGTQGYDYSKTVYFNPNLNSIIGGRSNGKSTLTNSIAAALNNSRFVKTDSETGHHMYVLEDSGLKVTWADGIVDNTRPIEFLPQDFMIKIAEDTELRDELIGKIVKNSSQNDDLVTTYQNALLENQQRIEALLAKRQAFIAHKEELTQPEGDFKGIQAEIQRLQEQITIQEDAANVGEDVMLAYKRAESNLQKSILHSTKLQQYHVALQSALSSQVEFSKEIPLVGEPEIDFQIRQVSDEIIADANNRWHAEVSKISTNLSAELNASQQQESNIKRSTDYVEGRKLIADHQILESLSKKKNEEKSKLRQVKEYLESLSNYEEKISATEAAIVKQYAHFKYLRDNLTREFSEKSPAGIEIKLEFRPVRFEDVITYLDARSVKNNEFINRFNSDSDALISDIFKLKDLSCRHALYTNPISSKSGK